MRNLLLVVVGAFFLMASSPARALTVSASADITHYLSANGGSASVTTYHFASVVSANNLEIGLYTLAMDATMFQNGTSLFHDRIWAGATILNHPGYLSSSWVQQAACLLIEGTYHGRTIGGAGIRPTFFASGIDSTGPLILNCPPIFDGPCVSAIAATDTTTVSLVGPDRGAKPASESVEFSLSRVESRGDETFIMDEWSLVWDGEIVGSSSPEFGSAVATQQDLHPQDRLLIVQEPIHAMNDRFTPKPVVRVVGGYDLPSELRGGGEIIVARIEFSPNGIIDQRNVFIAPDFLTDMQLDDLLAGRFALAFATEKRHRASVYVVLRLDQSIEVLEAFTVLPQCCCGEVLCA